MFVVKNKVEECQILKFKNFKIKTIKYSKDLEIAYRETKHALKWGLYSVDPAHVHIQKIKKDKKILKNN